MNNKYRQLTSAEVQQLQSQRCYAENWKQVLVTDSFTTENLFDVRFYGEIRLGSFEKEVEIDKNLRRKAGIYRAELRNVTIGNNCLIENIGSYIADYDIADGCYISNVGVMHMDGETCFGNGTEIHVLQETGDDVTLTLHSELTAQEAYLMVTNPTLNHCFWNEAIKKQYAPVSRGEIAEAAQLVGVTEICNTSIGCGAIINGALSLSDVTVLSSETDRTFVGLGCILRSSIVSYGANIADQAKVTCCFVGEAVHLGLGFSATDSVFFANSYMDNGEACAVVAGPFTVSHHKSTLLIGCMLSFANLGSGTNMSNHMYKMGPVHYGIMERGCKAASNAHLVWPARIGAFSMVMGKVATHVDSTDFPFSYLFGKEDKVYLAPGANSMTLGTFRDMCKWGERDKRKAEHRFDSVVTDGWSNPAIVEKVRSGLKALLTLQENQPNAEVYACDGMLIERKALEKGIAYYRKVLTLFWGSYYIHCLRYFKSGEKTVVLQGEEPADFSKSWVDVLGFPMPCSVVDGILRDVTKAQNPSAGLLNVFLRMAVDDYETYLYLWQQSADGISDEAVEAYVQDYPRVLSEQEEAVLADLEKEIRFGNVPQGYALEEKERIVAYFEEKKACVKAILSAIEGTNEE